MGKKLILLGLDGATWDVLHPLMDDGSMPNLKKAFENGVSAEMNSTFPPITAPAWLSMATGKNPGKTGVTDFRKPGEDLYERKTVNSSDFRENGAFWDMLNDNGFRTYLMGFPMVYPYYSIDGIIVGGWGTPDHGDIAYPSELDERIEDVSDGYVNYVPWDSDEYKKDKEKLIDDLSMMLEKQTKVVKDFLKDDCDFFTYI
ncbi:MAG: alkaline phosphatase family protein [Candidatus Thermoplasmatota archaeon]